MITDVFSLADITADELRWTERPWDEWPSVRNDGIGPKELARLAEVLGVGPSQEVLSGFSFLAGESQQSPWVVAIPEELTDRVAKLRGAELQSTADRWAVALDGRDAETPRLYLEKLVEFLQAHEGQFVLYIHSTG